MDQDEIVDVLAYLVDEKVRGAGVTKERDSIDFEYGEGTGLVRIKATKDGKLEAVLVSI